MLECTHVPWGGGAKHYFPPPLIPACQRLQFNLRRNIFQIKCPVESTVSALQWYHTQRRPIWIRVYFCATQCLCVEVVLAIVCCTCDATTSEIEFHASYMHHMRSSEGESRCDHIIDATSGWRDATSGWCQFSFPLLWSTCPLSTLQATGLSTRTQVLKGCERELETLLKWHDHFGVTILGWLIWRYYFSMTTFVWSGLFWSDSPTKSLPVDWSECHIYI